MKAKILLIIIIISFVALLACASYKPTSASVPMLDIDLYAGDTYSNVFKIADPNGPQGLTITVEPSGLIIGEPNILPIDGYPEARIYVYPFSFQAVTTGIKTFMITSTDSLGVVVKQQMIFDVKGNDAHVFIGVGEPNEPVSFLPDTVGERIRKAEEFMRYRTRSNLVWEYNRVVEGKQGLGWRYESLDELKDLIVKYDDPSYATMLGNLVEN